MTLEQLIEKTSLSNSTLSLLAILQNSRPAIVHLQGLIGSGVSLQVAATATKLPAHIHLIVCNEKEEAAYLMNDLQGLLKTEKLFFLPDSYSKTGDVSSEINNSLVLERTELLTSLMKHKQQRHIIVTYPEALIEKVVSQGVLQKHIVHFKKGEALNQDFIIELLVDLNFERTDFVYEPGQFSVRGGIMDIFSFGNDMPYRVELFGNEVESIRTFDPVTQLSNQNIAHVTIIPNTQTLGTGEIQNSLFDFLPTETIVWLKDAENLFQVTDDLGEKIKEAVDENNVQKKNEEEEKKQIAITDFETSATIKASLTKFKLIEFGTKNYFETTDTVTTRQLPQPTFNKNFELLIDDLLLHQSTGYTNFIFSDNPKQIERFDHIFEDIMATRKLHHQATMNASAIKFVPVGIALHNGFIDEENKMVCYTDHQIFERFHRYRMKVGYTRSNAITIKSLRELQPGDYVVHIDHGVGKYSGLQKLELNGVVQEVVRIFYKDNDVLYVNINSLHKISKYSGKEGIEPRINKIGSEAWEQLKRKTKAKVKEIAFDLIQLYAKRKAAKGFAFTPDTYLQNELEASFIYEDTPDQLKATQDVKADMEKAYPMDRLVCGDVGFGKTEIAVRAAFKAVADNKQVAILVPTTILAMQHAKTFAERLKDFPCTIEFVNRFKTEKQKKEILERLGEGKVDIIIGTHMLLGNKIKFKDLGLMIIDEEQKFGVAAKEKLKTIKTNVDTLTLTATPIPRTLQFSMMGARDLSIINTPPPNRQPVSTVLSTFNPDLIKEAIEHEMYRGGQVFFVHNKVHDIGEVAALIRKLCPAVEVGVAHGQMEGDVLEQRMLSFINREYDVLVCTNIVESGLDIANANTIIINSAHHFGLSDLHQLRGRVGRNNKKAYCYLLSPPMHVLTPEARRRLQTLEQFSDLGSGFQIAMRDMDIRGTGNLLGGEQSGFIAEIGFEMYHKILDEAIKELKEKDFKELFEDTQTDTLNPKFIKDCSIETDTEMLIPDDYVNNINERLSLYRQMDDIENEEGLQQFILQLADRFGPVPKQIEELFDAVRLRWVAKDLGFEKIMLKDKTMRCYFISEKQSRFYESEKFAQTMAFVNQHGERCTLKQTEKNLILIIHRIHSLNMAKEFLGKIG